MAIRKEKIEFFEKVLADYSKKAGRDFLPWRKKNITPYEVWVSEIMLQQTQVSRVVGYYERFLNKFPTVQKLAETTWEEFLPYYEGLGYYARGRNMLLAAQKIVSEYRGVFPRDKKELERMPGIGPYTASAIMSFAYNDEHLAWDTNLHRVIGRFFYGSKKSLIDTEVFENTFTTKRKSLNASLMDFGSSLCVGRPKCGACPLASRCVYDKEKGQKEQIVKKTKDIFGESEAEKVVVFLHENHRKYFSAIRDSYKPFILPVGYVTREAIKDWFFNNYDLTVSVRPHHKRVVFQKKRTLLMNVQILQGEHDFQVFPKEALKEYTRDTFST